MSKFDQDTKVNVDVKLHDPAGNAAAITPSDVTDMTDWCRGIYVGVTGDVVVVTANDQVVTFKNAVQGSTLPVRAKRVNSTLTTATDLVAIW